MKDKVADSGTIGDSHKAEK